MAFDRAGLNRLTVAVVDTLALKARVEVDEPLADTERDAQLFDRIRVIVHVLVLPHRGRHVEHVAGFPRYPLTLHVGVALTLDRIDVNGNYEPGNCRVISFKANTLKNDGTIEDHERVIAYMRGLL